MNLGLVGSPGMRTDKVHDINDISPSANERKPEKACGYCYGTRRWLDTQGPRKAGLEVGGHILNYATMLPLVENKAKLKERHIYTSKR